MNVSPSCPALPAIHSDVTLDRLAMVAGLILKVWGGVRRAHRPGNGDTTWGFGTRFHERMCHALRKASKKYQWLRLIERKMHFVFAIGGVPFRFYRGYAARPKKNYLLRRKGEVEQQKFSGIDIDWSCRIAIEGGVSDSAPRVLLVQHSVSTGEVRNTWQITADGQAIPDSSQSANPVQASLPITVSGQAEVTPPPPPQRPAMPPPPPLTLTREAIVQSPPAIRVKKFDAERASGADEEP